MIKDITMKFGKTYKIPDDLVSDVIVWSQTPEVIATSYLLKRIPTPVNPKILLGAYAITATSESMLDNEAGNAKVAGSMQFTASSYRVYLAKATQMLAKIPSLKEGYQKLITGLAANGWQGHYGNFGRPGSDYSYPLATAGILISHTDQIFKYWRFEGNGWQPIKPTGSWVERLFDNRPEYKHSLEAGYMMMMSALHIRDSAMTNRTDPQRHLQRPYNDAALCLAMGGLLRIGGLMEQSARAQFTRDLGLDPQLMSTYVEMGDPDDPAVEELKRMNGSVLRPGKPLLPKGSLFKVSSHFGKRGDRNHKGIDLAVPIGTPIFAVAAGRVAAVRDEGHQKGWGKYVQVNHSLNGSLYAHLSKQLVRPGQLVAPGQVIGLSGNTGRSSGPHLHFEWFSLKTGHRVDPLIHIPSHVRFVVP